MEIFCCGHTEDGQRKKWQRKTFGGLKLMWQRCTGSMDMAVCPGCKVGAMLPKIFQNKSCLQSVQLLQNLVRELVESRVASFASFCLVSQAHDAFGCVAKSGLGSQYLPLLLQDSQDCAPSSTRFPLFSARLFAVSTSNWSIEDAVQTGSALYYDCSADASRLPREAVWLKNAGMHGMLSLPCMHNGEVQGVLTLGTTSSAFSQHLILKLKELSCQITDLAMDAKQHMQLALAPASQLRRFESQGEVAFALVGEIINLDKMVMGRLASMQQQQLLHDGGVEATKPSSCSTAGAPVSGAGSMRTRSNMCLKKLARAAASCSSSVAAAAAGTNNTASHQSASTEHDSASSLLQLWACGDSEEELGCSSEPPCVADGPAAAAACRARSS